MPKIIKIDRLSSNSYKLYIYTDRTNKKTIDLVIGNTYTVSHYVDNAIVKDIGQLQKVTINNTKFTLNIIKNDRSTLKILSTEIDDVSTKSFKDNDDKCNNSHTHSNKKILDSFTLTQKELLDAIAANMDNKIEENTKDLTVYIDEQILTGGTGVLDGGEV